MFKSLRDYIDAQITGVVFLAEVGLHVIGALWSIYVHQACRGYLFYQGALKSLRSWC